MKFAWFSVGLPEYSPQQAVQNLKQAGYDGIEWRVIKDEGDTSKPGFWSGNRTTLQPDWSDAQFKEVAKMTADAGLSVPNLGSYAKAADLNAVKRGMEIAKIFNAPSLRVNAASYDGKIGYDALLKADIEHFGKVQDLAKQFGLKALIEIHMGLIVPSASAAYRLASNFSPEYIGVIHDAGNMVYEGYENYQMGLEILGKYLAHVHIKNSITQAKTVQAPQTMKWETTFGQFRTGEVDFTALLKALKTRGYNGWLSFEDFSKEATLEEKVKDNLALIKEIGKTI